MVKSFKALSLLAAVAAVFAAQPATATPASPGAIALTAGTNLTIVLVNGPGDTTITITACSAGCANDEVIASGNGFKFQALGGGQFEPTGTGNQDTNLTFTISTNDNAFLSGANVSIDGLNANAGYNLQTTTGGGLAGGSTQSTGFGTTAVTSKNFSGRTAVVFNTLDISASPFGANNGTTAGTNNVAVSFAVPEPASMALLAGGIATILIRRRRRS